MRSPTKRLIVFDIKNAMTGIIAPKDILRLLTGEKIRVDIASSSLTDEAGQFLATISISREVQAEALLRALNGITDTTNYAKE